MKNQTPSIVARFSRAPRTFVCLALALGSITTSSTQAVPVVQDVTGDWLGFFASPGLPPGPCRLSIQLQQNRSFSGPLDVEIPPGPCHVMINGAVSASNNVNFTGQDTSTNCMANTHVMFGDFGGGGALFDGDLMLTFGDGSHQKGSLLQLRSFQPPPDPEMVPEISGDYQGNATSDVSGQQIPMTVHFQHIGGINLPPSTLFAADLAIGSTTCPAGYATVSPQGEQTTIDGNPATSYELLVIGQGNDTNVRIMGTFDDRGGIPPSVRGQFQVRNLDGTEDHGQFVVVQQ